MCPASELSALGAAVKGYRIQYGLTQAALLEGSNIPLSFLRNLEQGRKRFVTADDIWALAAVLGWPEDELWELIPAGRTSPLFFPLYPQDAWPLSPGPCSTAIPGMARDNVTGE